LAHAHGFKKYHNTQLLVLLGSLKKHDMEWGYGMINSKILEQLLPWVLVRVPSNSKVVLFPSFMDICSPYFLLYNIWYTRPVIVLV